MVLIPGSVEHIQSPNPCWADDVTKSLSMLCCCIIHRTVKRLFFAKVFCLHEFKITIRERCAVPRWFPGCMSDTTWTNTTDQKQYNKEQIIKNENVRVLLFLKVFMYFVLQHYPAALVHINIFFVSPHPVCSKPLLHQLEQLQPLMTNAVPLCLRIKQVSVHGPAPSLHTSPESFQMRMWLPVLHLHYATYCAQRGSSLTAASHSHFGHRKERFRFTAG